MSTNAQIWLNLNNVRDAFQIPVNPEKIKLSYKGNVTSIKLDQFGEIYHIGKRDAASISFESFFPAHTGSYCAYQGAPDPQNCNKKIIDRIEAGVPVHFVYCNSQKAKSIDMYVVITSYSPYEQGGDPDTIHYSLEMKECRAIPMKVIRNGRLETTNTRADNSIVSKTVTIKKGDTLYKLGKLINKKKPKTGKKKIISLNKSTLSRWSKAYREASAKKKKKYIRNGSYRLLIGGTLRIK